MQFFALVLFSTPVLLAQGTGSITGTVRDNTGAVVPKAEVALTDTGTLNSLHTTTNAEGEYLFAAVPPGTYDLAINAVGFTKYESKGIILRVAQRARVDAALTVGEVKTAVTVEAADVTQVETESSEVSGIVTGKQISQLVLNGRNFTQLVTLTPGVSNQTGQDEGTVGVYGNVAYSVNGGRTEYNNWEIDGGDNMDNGSNSTLNVYPNVDAIAEVRVLTSNYGAQYGRNGSGTIETVTKSGTRDFHGDLFEFVRNDVFNARNFFADERPAYKKNDYGFTIGGPVFIPKLYNTQREKTFFFFSENWRKERVPGQIFHQQVPSNAERTGNFSDLCPGPDCPVDTNGAPFPNNQVPFIDPNAQTIMNAYIPAPNSVVGGQSYYDAATPSPTDWREELVRVDQNFTDTTRFFFRYIHDSWSTVTPTPLWAGGSFDNVKTNFVGPGVSLVAHLTNSISPTFLNEFTFSYTTDHIFLNAIGNVARPSTMTSTGIFDNGFGGLISGVSICCNNAYGGGFNEGAGYFPWVNSNPTYTYRDQIAKNIGNHNIFAGFYFAARQKNEQNSPTLQGTFNFSNTATANGSFPGSTGNAFADFLLGRIQSFSQDAAKVKFYNREKSFEPYFQDDWRVTSKLTINLGIRISFFGTYREKYLQPYNFDPTHYDPSKAPQIDLTGDITGGAGFLIPGSGDPFNGLVQCGKNGAPVGCMGGHLFNPAPRFGFAWDPFGKGKTAIRGGYGIFYEITNGNEGNTESLEGQPPVILNATQYNINGYTAVGGGGVASYPPLGPTSIPTQVRWPYVQQWHLDLQHELPLRILTVVSYVGSKGTHLTLQRDLNQLSSVPANQNPYAPGQAMTQADCNNGTVNGVTPTGQAAINFNVACGGNPDPNRPYLGYGTITQLENQANSNYNALQLTARRTAGRSQFSLAYTYSHSLDNSSDRYDGNFVDSYNLRRTYSSSNFDQTHLLNASWVYDLPFFQKSSRLVRGILGGWQISGLVTFQTGTPFSVTNGQFGPGVGNGIGAGSYVDIIGDPHAPPPVTEVAGITGPLLFNPGAFAQPQGLTFGNAGRNILRNPSRTNVDTGLFKRFAITEFRAFEFRAEAFNVFNHTQWSGVNSGANCYGGPNNSAGDSSCLVSSFLHPSGAHNPRILQLGMKFLF
jgi:hypothetical protein